MQDPSDCYIQCRYKVVKMASITDCVVEGLKYPFSDIKKVLGFGVLFAVLNLISLYTNIKNFDMFRIIQNSGGLSSFKLSMLPANDIYMIVGLAIVSFIISLYVMGYQYDLIKFSIDKKEDLPGFSDVLNLFVKGIKCLMVGIAYNIIPAIVFVIGVLLVSNSTGLLLCITLISSVLFIIAFFLQIMAINNMVAYDNLKKAFDFREIFDNISNLGWGKYLGTVIFTWIVFIIIIMATGFVLSIVSLVFAAAISNQALAVSAFITVIEGLFVTSYVVVFYSRVCGSIYREAIK